MGVRRAWEQYGPAAPSADLSGDRDAFAMHTIETLNPILLRTAVAEAAKRIQTAGWTITLAESISSLTTATPDLLWDRIVIWGCGGWVSELTFD